MNMWIIASVIVGVMVIAAAGTAIALDNKQDRAPCGCDCSGTCNCTAANNCGSPLCHALTEGSCGCAKKA